MRLSARPLRLGAAIALTAMALCAGAPASLAAAPGQKGPIRGLVTMGKLAFLTHPGMLPDNTLREANAHPGVYAGAVIIATWDQLEPQRGQFDFSTIDFGLDAIRAYNQRYRATPLVAKLRIFGAAHAPGWAMALDGGPVMLSERNLGFADGHFWSPPYRAAWRELQAKLAAHYDTDPLVAEVAISSCASLSAEPFVVPMNPEDSSSLIAAGYTDAAMQACLTGAIDDYAAWTHVALDYTFNPWRSLATGRPRPAPGFAEGVMQQFRSRLGSRAVIANHGLTPEINPPARGVMDMIQRLGPPIEFQTRSPVQDWDATMRTGESLGVTEMEVWETRDAGGPAPVSIDDLHQWHDELVR
jgi:hypothetical protein